MRHYFNRLGSRLAGSILLPTLMVSPLLGQGEAQPPPIPEEELPVVLNRGPVHEAFAEPIPMESQDPVSVQPAPPPLINEQPPEEKPEGHYVWVPGYWAWDQERNAYIWVSACWRIAPPGMYWVPGYWVQNGDRWEWVSGFWAQVKNKEIEYLPPPPPLEDVAPPGPQPENGIWVSPCWYWYSDQYVLRPGYWLNAHPDWLWQPSHYIWTPRGYVFVQGHWDYTLERRGVLFAPVYFPSSFYSGSYYRSYTPSVIVNLGILTGFLFTYPRYHHYYFGDYYDSSYVRFGIYPWFESARYRTWYDPIYHHRRWNHRDDSRWEQGIRDVYNRRVQDQNLRPPRTHRDWERKSERLSDEDRRQYRLTRSWQDAVRDRDIPVPTKRIDADGRRAITTQSEDIRRLRQGRVNWEGEGKGTAGQTDAVRVPSDAPMRESRGDRVRTTDEAPALDQVPRTPSTTRDRDERAPRQRDVQPAHTQQQPPTIQPQTTPDLRREDRPIRQRDVQPALTPQPPPTIQRQPAPDIRREDRPVRQREVLPTPTPQTPSVYQQPGPARQIPPTPQPRVRVTQPERVRVPDSNYTKPPPAPAPGLQAPPDPEDEGRIRRGRDRL
jgi:hypothetical protein